MLTGVDTGIKWKRATSSRDGTVNLRFNGLLNFRLSRNMDQPILLMDGKWERQVGYHLGASHYLLERICSL